jgi:hypothetical protein
MVDRHPRALTTDTYGRKKTLSKSGTFYWESIKVKLNSFPETNFLYEFLMKSSRLLSTFAPIFSEAAAGQGTMSLTAFIALCILGLDLLVCVLFQRIYGANAAQFPPSGCLERAIGKPFWVVSRKAGHGCQESAQRGANFHWPMRGRNGRI